MNARDGCGTENRGEGKFGEQMNSGPYVSTVGN
jgi:hypothetical protein